MTLTDREINILIDYYKVEVARWSDDEPEALYDARRALFHWERVFILRTQERRNNRP